MLVRHGLRLLVAGLLLTGLTIGCEDNNQSFIILGNVVGVPQQAGPCTYAVDSTLVLRAGGTVDVSVRNNYIASLAVENQLILRRDELNARAETSYGVFRDAEVRMTDGAGNAVTSFTTPVTQNDVPPGARRGIVFTPMVDPNLMNKLATELKHMEGIEMIEITKRDVARLAKHHGIDYKTAEKRFLPMQMGDVPATYADVEDLARDVGFSPATPIEVGVERFVKWYRGHYGV